MRYMNLVLTILVLWVSGNKALAHDYPWSLSHDCELGIYGPKGLLPAMRTSLEDLSIAHRITQGLNPSKNVSNYHGADYELNGVSYSAAVDLSVRCLDDEQIKLLMGELAMRGFASWLRRDGVDGWSGPAHIHAIWVSGQLKPQLSLQVINWLAGRNGLRSNKPYEYWSPTDKQLLAVTIAHNQ